MTVQSNDIIRVAARSEFLGIDDIVNVFEIRNSGASVANDADAISDIIDFLEAFYIVVRGLMKTTQLFRDLNFFNVTQNIAMGVHPWKTLTGGTSSGDQTPPGVAAVISFPTIVPKVQFRKFIGALDETATDPNGSLSSGTVTTLTTAANVLLSGHTGTYSTYVFGGYSPKIAAWVGPYAAVITDIPGYQRRRKQGRGS